MINNHLFSSMKNARSYPEKHCFTDRTTHLSVVPSGETVFLHDLNTNDNLTTSTDFLPHCLSVSANCLALSGLYTVTRTRTGAQVMSHSLHPHGHVHVSVSPRLALPFYFLHFLPHSFPFLLHLKFVDYLNLLRTPHKEGMDSSDDPPHHKRRTVSFAEDRLNVDTIKLLCWESNLASLPKFVTTRRRSAENTSVL